MRSKIDLVEIATPLTCGTRYVGCLLILIMSLTSGDRFEGSVEGKIERLTSDTGGGKDNRCKKDAREMQVKYK